MTLNHQEIKANGLVEDAIEGGWRSASYDLTIESILIPNEKSVRQSYRIKPQEVIVVISKETIKLPEDVVGQALPKTSLTHDGILALSTGLIDPKYEGPISSTLINFGKESIRLN